MCIAIPFRVIEIINKKIVKIETKNGEAKIDVSLLSNLKENDWILVQGNAGVKKIDKKTADEIFKLLK